MSKNKKRERENPCAVCGHYHDYEGGEPCTLCGHRLMTEAERPPPSASSLPTEIIPGFLYLGSYDDATRSSMLEILNIRHVLGVVPGVHNVTRRGTFTYCCPTEPPTVPAALEEGLAFLGGCRQARDGGEEYICRPASSEGARGPDSVRALGRDGIGGGGVLGLMGLPLLAPGECRILPFPPGRGGGTGGWDAIRRLGGSLGLSPRAAMGCEGVGGRGGSPWGGGEEPPSDDFGGQRHHRRSIHNTG